MAGIFREAVVDNDLNLPRSSPLFGSLVVYIPTYNNYDAALGQVSDLRRQGDNLTDPPPWTRLQIIVSINGGTYDEDELQSAGATTVIQRPVDLGGDTNIALGFLYAERGDLLWILSDNDPVQSKALETIAMTFAQHSGIDLLVASSDPARTGITRIPQSVLDLGGAVHVGLISGVVYRYDSIAEAVPIAFQALWTGWSQIAVQDFAVAQGKVNWMFLVPTNHLIQHTRGNQTKSSVDRARSNYSHSYYGGGLRSFVMAEMANGTGRVAISDWWRKQWIYASAYRPPLRPRESKRTNWDGSPATNYRAGLAEALVRTGSLRDRSLWLISWLPYWRLALALKALGIRNRHWT